VYGFLGVVEEFSDVLYEPRAPSPIPVGASTTWSAGSAGRNDRLSVGPSVRGGGRFPGAEPAGFLGARSPGTTDIPGLDWRTGRYFRLSWSNTVIAATDCQGEAQRCAHDRGGIHRVDRFSPAFRP
jgi:hypothetical protein